MGAVGFMRCTTTHWPSALGMRWCRRPPPAAGPIRTGSHWTACAHPGCRPSARTRSASCWTTAAGCPAFPARPQSWAMSSRSPSSAPRPCPPAQMHTRRAIACVAVQRLTQHCLPGRAALNAGCMLRRTQVLEYHEADSWSCALLGVPRRVAWCIKKHAQRKFAVRGCLHRRVPAAHVRCLCCARTMIPVFVTVALCAHCCVLPSRMHL